MDTVFALLDETGRPRAFYRSDIHAAAIPADAVEITQAAWEECLANPGRRRIEDGAAVPLPVARPTAADLLAYLAERRWRAEVAGCDWNGWHLPTDERSQSKYLSELAAVNEAVRIDGSPWKFPHGFEAVTNDQIRAMAVAARGHVLACFAKEGEITAAIAAGTITTTAQIDTAFANLGGDPQVVASNG